MYDLKYQSDFYNIFKKLVSVKIYKKDYGTHALISVRTAQVILEVNYQANTPVIGTGVKVVLVNTGTFTSLDDLLTSTEKQFKCVIEYNGAVVFQGFSICDLNEQQFLPNARIVLQFTDYLKRLEGDFLTALATISANSSVYDIIAEAIVKTGLQNGTTVFPLSVNSTLFETRMLDTGLNTFINQTFVDNNMFYQDATTYDDTYVALNKVLKSFGAFLYSLGDRLVLERIDDITRTGDWVHYATASGTVLTSLKKEVNKQNGDFHYIDTSQVIGYNSGLKTLILNLKDKQLGSLVFNDYKIDMLTTPDEYPQVGTMLPRKWYLYVGNAAAASGINYRGMSTYFKYIAPPSEDTDRWGLYYNFKLTFNVTPDVPTELSVSYKAATDDDLTDKSRIKVQFAIMLDGGDHAYSGYYLADIIGPGGVSTILGLSATPFIFETSFDISETGNNVKMWQMNKIFNFTDNAVVDNPPFPPTVFPGIWYQLGRPETQKFVICFFPNKFGVSIFHSNTYANYIGDVQVVITQQQILNKLTYYINEDFIKTEELDMDFFDLDNENFSNGLMISGLVNDSFVLVNEDGTPLINTGGGSEKTKLWTTYQYTEAKALLDIFARVKFGNNFRTLHKLKGTIQHDGHLKPFSILTDDNLEVDSDTLIKFLLQGYTWDLVNGTYEIEAEEYTEEEIVLDITGEIPVIPPAQEWTLIAEQAIPGNDIYVYWDAIPNAVSYVVERRPDGADYASWSASWVQIYAGTDLGVWDLIAAEPADMVNGMTIEYKVKAINANGESSLYSPITSIIWAS